MNSDDMEWEDNRLAEILFKYAIKRPSDVSADDVVKQLRQWLRAELEVMGVQSNQSERGFYEYECVVCGDKTTSSTIYAGQWYDPGDHCGRMRRKVRWVSEGEKP